MSNRNIVIGIDPGSLRTGYGIVCQDGTRLIHIHSGIIDVRKETSIDQRLKKIQDQLDEVIKNHRPNMAALETVFYAKNVKSAITLAHARGVALCTAAQNLLSIYEYSPLSVKEACVGYGRATKDQIQTMVLRLLGISKKEIQSFDQTDALAIGICHLHSNQIQQKISKQSSVHV